MFRKYYTRDRRTTGIEEGNEIGVPGETQELEP